MTHNHLKSLVVTLALVAVPMGASAQTGDDTTGTTTTETATTETTQTENRGPGFPGGFWDFSGLLA
ncbi:hypothetical protein ACFSC4_26025 [Deinococcus malanensis]|uniref:hypothetical protein n=1 Tax=Deinococcus malanensis TaxID=1706855 RepID=UPI003644EBE4